MDSFLGNVFKDVEQMIPNHLYGRDVETLIRCVDKPQCRTEAHHVEVRIAFREETALETGMDATNDRSLAKQFLVGGYDDFREFGVCLIFQAG